MATYVWPTACSSSIDGEDTVCIGDSPIRELKREQRPFSLEHRSGSDTRPYLGGQEGNIYLHEDGTNNDGAAIAASLTLAPFSPTDGGGNFELDGLHIDIKDQAGNVAVEVSAYE